MARVATVSLPAGAESSSNTALVTACLAGDQEAWAILVDRYKRLIYSIPIRQGFDPDEAADIFQAVCLDLVAELPRLREPEALPQWLIQTTSHRCHRHRKQRRHGEAEMPADLAAPASELPESMIHELQQEQAVRDAMRTLPSRCHRMIDMLFFQTPARPYADVAAQLGIATGSVGFIRGRCLDRLRRALKKAGL
jgi:RNA polymerase sigma factor (sigma-70 family)